MTALLVTGAARPLGRRVCFLAAQDPEVTRVVAVDDLDLTPVARAWPTAGPELVTRRLRLDRAELGGVVDGVTSVVHLAAAGGTEMDGTGVSGVDLAGTRMLLGTLRAIESFVVLSSATVYGAWPQNPVPLTEQAPLRPNPGFSFGFQKAELERLVAEWAETHWAEAPRAGNGAEPGGVAVLRPTLTLSAESTEWMARSLWGIVGVRAGEDVPPAQFLHLDDLAAAVHLARQSRLSGVFNVAPDGWIPPDALDGLRGTGPRLPLPGPLASWLAAVSFRLSLTSTPEGALPYTMHPWVVANDRLRAAGWNPAWSNEETFVAGTRAAPWSGLNARRRQEIGLAVATVGTVGLIAAITAGVRRLVRGASS